VGSILLLEMILTLLQAERRIHLMLEEVMISRLYCPSITKGPFGRCSVLTVLYVEIECLKRLGIGGRV
jgi:hypothetical protein